DDWNERQAPPRRQPRNDGRPAGAQRRRAPKRRKKRGMGRVIEVCLEQFGPSSPAPAAHHPQPSPPPHAAARPQAAPQPQATPRPQAAAAHRKRRPLTLVAPVEMDLSKPGPEISELKVEPPRLEQPLPAQMRSEAERKPDTRLGQLVAHCRSGA